MQLSYPLTSNWHSGWSSTYKQANMKPLWWVSPPLFTKNRAWREGISHGVTGGPVWNPVCLTAFHIIISNLHLASTPLGAAILSFKGQQLDASSGPVTWARVHFFLSDRWKGSLCRNVLCSVPCQLQCPRSNLSVMLCCCHGDSYSYSRTVSPPLCSTSRTINDLPPQVA